VQLISGQPIKVRLGDMRVTMKHFAILKKVSQSSSSSSSRITDDFHDILFSYLFLTGYLTVEKKVS